MTQKKIKMIGVDFDWTLIDHAEEKPRIDPALLQYLAEFIRNGGYAGIVTGRMVYDLHTLFQVMDIPWCNPFPNFYVYRESFIDFMLDGIPTSWEEYNAPARRRISEKAFGLGQFVGQWLKVMEEKGLQIERWNLFGDFGMEYHMVDSDNAQKALPVLHSLLAQSKLKGYSIHRNGRMATVFDADSGKGNVLLHAAEHAGLEPCQVLAIGDSLNDLSMLDGSRGFVSGCVGNADEQVKDIVRQSGGYIGTGRASSSILDIIRQLEKQGRI